MRKLLTTLVAALACCILLSSCGEKTAEEPPVVYSFQGENEMFSISNGVIILDSPEETFYGGDFEAKQDKLSDIAAFTSTFYIKSGNEETVLSSNSVEDMTGGTLNVPLQLGKVSGDILPEAKTDELENNFYFELKTTNIKGEENEYNLQLSLTEVTKENEQAVPG